MTNRRIALDLRLDVGREIERLAVKQGCSVSDYIERLVMEHLARVQPQAASSARAAAELALVEWACSWLDDRRRRGEWDQHVTLHLFEAIEAEQLAVYRAATADGYATRINRQLGALARERLGAEVKMTDGRRAIAQLSRAYRGLIRTYTLLAHPSDSGGRNGGAGGA